METENKKIVTRIVLGIPFQLISPLCIANGENINTDNDVLRNKNGMPFIPGTSLAGVIRNYLSIKDKEKTLFGYSIQDEEKIESRMSSIYFSDAVLENAKICFRDGIAFSDSGWVENKFNWEVVDAGAKGVFWIEIVLREGNSEDKAYSFMKEAIRGIKDGKVRLGYRKNRGFGKLKIDFIYEWTFRKENNHEWIAFKRPELIDEQEQYKYTIEQWLGAPAERQRAQSYASIVVPLKLDGGISIRQYRTKAGDADFEHITSNNQAVIPGTSWNGAIRTDCKKILNELGISSDVVENAIFQWFGNRETKHSSIVIDESILENSAAVQYSRNKVNRFDASTVTNALYTEVANFTGNTKLVLQVTKKEKEWKVIVGMLLLVIQDIQSGFLPIGGQVAVGRGIFKANGEVKLENCQREECEGEIAKWVMEHTKQ